jgi:uncharacterized protein DUF262/uncharacterized protein DUF1524
VTSQTPTDLGIHFDISGISGLLSHHTLRVPLNQRSYAWETEQVSRLFQDLASEIQKVDGMHFLGAIVLAHDEQGNLLVADGQQRLATTSILIAAIRDYLSESTNLRDKRTADKYTHTYLLEYDEHHDEDSPKLYLNAMDRGFFADAILAPPSPERLALQKAKKKFSSHERLFAAFEIAREFVETIVAPLPKNDRSTLLHRWVQFLESRAVVIAIRVPKDIDAYRMFETLNDRGLRASQVDILKSHLFKQAEDRLETDASPRWASMVSVIETLGDDELVLSYVRHFWITRQGPTTEDDLAKSFKENVVGRKQAVEMVIALEQQATDYIALLTPLDHPRLKDYGKESRACLAAITGILRIIQIRPLLLVILQKFPIPEAKRAFEMCLSWSVRFLIAGGGGGGVLEKNYGKLAKKVFSGEVATANKLAEEMAPIVPDDRTFDLAFRIYQVTKIVQARYYLHSLENFKRGEDKPQLGYFEAPESSVNLEHIMPDREAEGWDVPLSEMQGNYKRIGNMTLLASKVNAKIGMSKFEQKKQVYRQSTFLLTQEVAEYSEWKIQQIDERQGKLAALAPKVWPL